MANVDLLVIGGSGFVGAKLTQAAARTGLNVAYTYLNHELRLSGSPFKVDVLDAQAVELCIAKSRPGTVVYCANPPPQSYDAEHQKLSVEGVQNLIGVLDPSSCKLVYVSTNAVFSGKRGNYSENDTPDPEDKQDLYQEYGIAKALGERLVLNDWPNSIVVRTADVNGRDVDGRLNSRLEFLVRQLRAGRELERLSRCYISPTLVDDLVAGLLQASSRNFNYKGILHLAGSERVSYYDFTRLIARQIGADEELVRPDVSREQDLSLDTKHTQQILSTRFLSVRDQLSDIFPDSGITAPNKRSSALF
jgi:dTDP-4-dehydrorhamnose reductase